MVRRFARGVLLAALSVLIVLQLSCERQRPTIICLAGDEWFLGSLTKTGLIAEFERDKHVQVVVLHKNDRAIMNDLDRGPNRGESLDVIVVRHRLLGALVLKGQVEPIDSFLADSTVHESSFAPREQLFSNWWRELSSYDGKIYGFPYTGLTTSCVIAKIS